MTTIRVPASRLVPEQDHTETALHNIGQIAKDFEHALADANSVAKCIQLRERVTACIAVLIAVERAGFDKTDRLSEAKA
jgi:hypothetical protein